MLNSFFNNIRHCQKNDWSGHAKFCRYEPDPVGFPFIVSLAKSKCTVQNLYTVLAAYSRYSVDVSRCSRSSTSSQTEETESTEFPQTKFIVRYFPKNDEKDGGIVLDPVGANEED